MKSSNPQKINKTASNIFTDREAPRAAFWKIYNNLEPGDVEIINYYGIGGIGKSSLLKQLQVELDEHGNDKYISYNFESREKIDMVLYDISRKLMDKYKNLKFPVFDYAFEKINKLGKDLVEQENILEHHTVGNTLNAASEFIPYVNVVTSAINEGAKFAMWLAKRHEKLKGTNADLYSEITAQNNDGELLKRLPHYFSIDAYEYFKNYENREPLVIMLDGYEVLVNKLEKGDKAKGDDLWLREEGSLVYSIPNTIWVIAGREKLDWSEDMLPQDQTHLIGNLGKPDAMDFFCKSGITNVALEEGLYELSGGTPVYMDLCVRQYNKYIEQYAKEPSLDYFGKDTEEIAIRFLRDMTIMEQGIMHLLSCLPATWNDEMVEELAKKLKYDFSQNEYRLIKNLTLVEAIDSDGIMYKLHETFRKVVLSQINRDEKVRIMNGVKDMLVPRLVDIRERKTFAYNFTSVVFMCKHNYDLLSFSVDDVNKIAWAICRYHIQYDEYLIDFGFLKDVLVNNKESDWANKYVWVSIHEIHLLNYYDRDKEALVATRELYEFCNNNDVDDESMVSAEYLLGWRLFLSDIFDESKQMLESAISRIETGASVKYNQRKQILSCYAELMSILEEEEKYDSIISSIIKECDKELAKLSVREKTNENWKNYYFVMRDKADFLEKCNQDKEALEVRKDLLKTLIENNEYYSRVCVCKIGIAKSLFYMNQYHDAIEILNDVMNILKQNDAEDYEYEDVYEILENCYFYLHQYDSALEWAEKSLHLAKSEYGEESLSVSDVEDIISDVYRKKEDYEKAEEHLINSITIKEKVLEPNRIELCETKEHLASLYALMDKLEKSNAIWNELYKKYSEIFSEKHRKAVIALFRTSDMYFWQEDYETAKNIGEKAYALLIEKEDRFDKDILYAARDLAHAHMQLENYPEARKYAEKALEIILSDEYADDTLKYDSYRQCFWVYEMMDDYEKALEMAEVLYKLVNSNREIFEDSYWEIYSQLGKALRENDRSEEALKIHLEVLEHYKILLDEAIAEQDALKESQEDSNDVILELKQLVLNEGVSLSIDYESLEMYKESLEIDEKNYTIACEIFGEDSEEAAEFLEYIEEDREKLK